MDRPVPGSPGPHRTAPAPPSASSIAGDDTAARKLGLDRAGRWHRGTSFLIDAAGSSAQAPELAPGLGGLEGLPVVAAMLIVRAAGRHRAAFAIRAALFTGRPVWGREWTTLTYAQVLL